MLTRWVQHRRASRLVRGIHPPILTDRGLAAALAALAGDAPPTVSVRADGLGALPAAVESAAYFVVAEALANTVKHAGATTCTITVTRADPVVTVAVTDDGVGGADDTGSGLDGLRRRVEALGRSTSATSWRSWSRPRPTTRTAGSAPYLPTSTRHDHGGDRVADAGQVNRP